MPIWKTTLKIYSQRKKEKKKRKEKTFNGWQLAKMKKSIPDMPLP